MATVEVPFETPEQIKEKLLDFEGRFQNRYKVGDPWYARASQRDERLVRIN